MKTYIVLLRGINVGGKNPVPMQRLREELAAMGFGDVVTYIASGNVILRSGLAAADVERLIERELPKRFTLHDERVRVLALTPAQLRAIVRHKPPHFGDTPAQYHSDAIFLIGITAAAAIRVFTPKEGVDRIWPGKGVIYSQRLSAERTKSRLNRIMSTPEYKQMTIRNWNTVTRLVALADA